MRFDRTQPIPLLILGDAPDAETGLARVGHDLAWLLSSMPEFKVGYLGRGAVGRSYFPWTQYSFPPSQQWGENLIEQCWRDLAGDKRGIVFTVWDATRLLWLADPMGMPDSFQRWLQGGAIERWGYFMQDSEGVQPGKIPLTAAHVMGCFDRVLLASKWAYDRTRNTIPSHADTDWLPHMINTKSFCPQDREIGRSILGVSKDEILIGCVMTNQARKHWPTVMEAVARMRPTAIGKAKLWAKSDVESPKPGWGYWNLVALTHELGLDGRVLLDVNKRTDKDMSVLYSACDATVLISGGEGFGYPIAESLACGVPVVTGDYGAGAEIASHCVSHHWTTIETQHNVKRGHYSAALVAEALEQAVEWSRGEWIPQYGQERVEHLSSTKLGVQWKKWFLAGL